MDRAQKNAPWWLKVLVAFHLVAIIGWSLPRAPQPVLNGSKPAVGTDHILIANEKYVKGFPPIQAYLMTTGFWQYWDMFAPDPAQEDYWGDAEVVRQDGSVERVRYPRMYDMPIYQKYFFERFRKFHEREHSDGFNYLWPRFAHKIAASVDNQPNNRPVEVRLYRHWQKIGKMDEPLPTDYESYMYWTEVLDRKWLDQVKRS